MKKFSGKTLEENKEEEGSEPPKVETQEVRLQAGTSPQKTVFFFRFLWKSVNVYTKVERMKSELTVFWWRLVMSELKRSSKSLDLVLCVRSFSALLGSVL